MRYALVNGRRQLPRRPPPGMPSAVCPACGGEVIAKTGSIVVHHWAHKSLEDCDRWYEPMTEWHLKFQLMVPEEWREVVIIKEDIKHRADIRTPPGRVIELQHSHISPEQIKEREDFYDNMIWLFDARTFGVRTAGGTKTPDLFGAKSLPKSILRATRPVFLDTGSYILYAKSIKKCENKKFRYEIDGTMVVPQDFVSLFLTVPDYDCTTVDW